MKKILIFALLSFFIAKGHGNTSNAQDPIEVGDILVIGKPSAQQYQHIHFPKTNFIIKKGGIPNYKSLIGERVIVTEVAQDKEGNRKITLKREDGRKFFNSISRVKINLEKALENKEVVLVR
ncbi:hypothetical protein [Aquimarina algiphila]|uniref:Uncharacterized protein n=1 Tax=Aquimarina algiphila TaxID=2047982 RepID=A0A554VDS3_9FLAO|nr:hypothetical protein [Aquimarina algiphila]TSE05064.1 hypothetical protein FOF46_24315 [Aquimarina algiphila]